MTRSRQSFTCKWSRRFLGKKPRLITAQNWCDQLGEETAHCNWIRMVVTTWQHEPFQDVKGVEALIHWLDQACAHPVFVKNRGVHTVQAGVQIWFSHLEDVMAFKVCVPDHVWTSRHMDHDQAKQDWIRTWMPTPPLPHI